MKLASIDQIKTAFLPIYILLSISERTVIQAFYLAKMTCVKETENANFEYTYLHMSEFFEFIGRLAWLKYMDTYEDTQWRLV